MAVTVNIPWALGRGTG